MTKKQKKLQAKRKKAFYKKIEPIMISLKKFLLTDISISEVPMLFKLDAFTIKLVRGIILFIIASIQFVKKTKKRILVAGKVKKGAIKGLNLAGSGYQLYTKAEPLIKSQLSKSKKK